MVINERARAQEDKAERRQAILRAARAAFARGRFADITMAALARRAGLAKGTTYLYFGTKEELFLALLQQELWDWLDGVERGLVRLPRPVAARALAALLARSLARRATLTRLLAILHTRLEHNLDERTALEFKRALLERTQRTGQALEAALGFLRPGEGLALLMRIDALLIGLWQMADPAPVMHPLLRRPELRAFRVRFAAALQETLEALLVGMQALREAQPQGRGGKGARRS